MKSSVPPRVVAQRMAQSRDRRKTTSDAFRRDTFVLPRAAARAKAREFFELYPSQAYMTAIDSWRELPDGHIEFTMRRLPSAD
jgi:hypothetical protein